METNNDTMNIKKNDKTLLITQNENIELQLINNNPMIENSVKEVKQNYSIQFSNRDGKIYEIMEDFYSSLVDFYNISPEMMDAIYKDMRLYMKDKNCFVFYDEDQESIKNNNYISIAKGKTDDGLRTIIAFYFHIDKNSFKLSRGNSRYLGFTQYFEQLYNKLYKLQNNTQYLKKEVTGAYNG